MGLRNRLWLVLGAIVVVPLLVAAFAIVFVVDQGRGDRVASELTTTARAVGSGLSQQCSVFNGLSARLAIEAAATGDAATLSPALEAALQNALDAGAGFAAVVSGRGAVSSAGVVSDEDARTAHSCQQHLEAPYLAGVSRIQAAKPTARDGSAPPTTRAVVGASVDGGWLQQALRDLGSGGEVVLVVDGRPVASSLGVPLSDPRIRRIARGAETPDKVVRRDGQVLVAQSVEPGSPIVAVVAQPAPDRRALVLLWMGLAAVIGLLGAALARIVVGGLIRPLVDLAETSERAAAGDLTVEAPVSDDEVGRLGRSFNRMTEEMRQYLGALERSRDELRDNLERLGEALGSTHDLDGLVQVVLESAVAASYARGGAAYVAETSGSMTLVAAQGIEELDVGISRRVLVGSGVLGRVAAGGATVRGCLGTRPGEITPGPDDPTGGEVLAVPLRGGGRVTGVLVLIDRLDGSHFLAQQEDEIRVLAAQAGIAIDNVLLHRETERLAITDSLTGLWNFRYLSMSLAREIERASRFERSLAVLMLDIDHFKTINDTYGHATGDEVLREFAARVGEQTREVDVFARYGGEEFVLVLPETQPEGALLLAERVRVAISASSFPGPEGTGGIPVTVSIGLAYFPEHGGSPATLLRSADNALYAAKRAGRDRVHVGESPDAAPIGRMAGWEPS